MNKVLHRLRIAQGHLDKVVKMYERGEYCIDTLIQSQAVQAALKETDALILENHLQTCVTDAVKSGKKDKAIAEVIKVFKKKS